MGQSQHMQRTPKSIDVRFAPKATSVGKTQCTRYSAPEETSRQRLQNAGVGSQFGDGSSHCVGTPNSKPHLMVARRTIVDADMRVPSFRQWRACDMHFIPAPTLGQFGEAGHQ